MTQFRIDLPEDQAASLGALAASQGTTPEALLAQAAQTLLADATTLETWLAAGEADAAAGRVVPFSQVLSDLDEIIVKAEARRT